MPLGGYRGAGGKGNSTTVSNTDSQCTVVPLNSRADYAAWLPGNCQVGRLVRRPGEPPRQTLI